MVSGKDLNGFFLDEFGGFFRVFRGFKWVYYKKCGELYRNQREG
jgi:hypothetical protein